MVTTNILLCLLMTTPQSQPQYMAVAEPAVIRATGLGRPPARMAGPRAKLMARRAAEVAAVKNLSGKLAADGRELRGFRYIKTVYRSDGWVEVTVESACARVKRGTS